jgi:hypothetical protein
MFLVDILIWSRLLRHNARAIPNHCNLFQYWLWNFPLQFELIIAWNYCPFNFLLLFLNIIFRNEWLYFNLRNTLKTFIWILIIFEKYLKFTIKIKCKETPLLIHLWKWAAIPSCQKLLSDNSRPKIWALC